MTQYSRQLAHQLTASYTNNSWALPTVYLKYIMRIQQMQNRAPGNESYSLLISALRANETE